MDFICYFINSYTLSIIQKMKKLIMKKVYYVLLILTIIKKIAII